MLKTWLVTPEACRKSSMKWNRNKNSLIIWILKSHIYTVTCLPKLLLEELPHDWWVSSSAFSDNAVAPKRKWLVVWWKQSSCAGVLYPGDDNKGNKILNIWRTITELRITVESLRLFKHSSVLHVYILTDILESALLSRQIYNLMHRHLMP